MDLKQFLVIAKRDTYASGKSPVRLPDGFDEFVFEKGEFRYRDRYLANDPRPFAGQEVVWQNGNPVWVMNYYGGMAFRDVDSKKVSEFLRKAMSQVPEDKPFRGPMVFREGDFRYWSFSSGDVDRFKGDEGISFQGREVYALDYQGGKL